MLRDFVEAGLGRLADTAAWLDLTIASFATTMMVVVSDGTTTTHAHVGDGFIAIQSANDSAWRCLSPPDRGEYAGTTSFLTDGKNVVRAGSLELPVVRICLSTDGLEPVAWNVGASDVHSPFLSGVAGAIAPGDGLDVCASARLRRWLRSDVLAQRVTDDLTLCMMVRPLP